MGPGTTRSGRRGARGAKARTAGRIGAGLGTGRRVRAGLGTGCCVGAGLGTGCCVGAGLGTRRRVRAGLGTGCCVRAGLGAGRRVGARLGAGRRVGARLGINLGRCAEGMAGSLAGLDIPTVTSFGLEGTTGFIGRSGRGPVGPRPGPVGGTCDTGNAGLSNRPVVRCSLTPGGPTIVTGRGGMNPVQTIPTRTRPGIGTAMNPDIGVSAPAVPTAPANMIPPTVPPTTVSPATVSPATVSPTAVSPTSPARPIMPIVPSSPAPRRAPRIVPWIVPIRKIIPTSTPTPAGRIPTNSRTNAPSPSPVIGSVQARKKRCIQIPVLITLPVGPTVIRDTHAFHGFPIALAPIRLPFVTLFQRAQRPIRYRNTLALALKTTRNAVSIGIVVIVPTRHPVDPTGTRCHP